MIKRTLFLLKYFFLLVAIFVLGKIGFMYYNAEVDPFSPIDLLSVILHGLPQDAVMAGYLTLVPYVLSLAALQWDSLPLRRILTPYYILVGFAVAAIIAGDVCMYEYWEFKLHSVVFSYMTSPEGTTNSVSLGYLLSRLGSIVGILLVASVPPIYFTPRNLENRPPSLFFFERFAADVVVVASVVVGLAWMNVGRVYYSNRLFLNHSAVNPVYSFAGSFSFESDYSKHYDYLPEDKAEKTFRPLYAKMTDEGSEKLLRTERPNVLVVLVESFGGKFVGELGGIPEVSPQISRLIPEGVFWDNFYANSFRTDRGTTSLYNGWVAYPTASLMMMKDRHSTLPSLPKSLAKEGYETYYLMGGPMTNLGKEQYMTKVGFKTLYNDKNGFSAEEVATGTWGAVDSISAERTVQKIQQMPKGKNWLMGYQTLSSHEPFIVPYNRLEDKVLNGFAYTDECLGLLIRRLKQLPEWDDMLVIILADHGFMYQLSYQDPEFFHIPMLWLGGALKEPRRIHTLMNQSDVCATLLAQMGLSHDDYPWSRNVLSPDYKYPFVYSNYPAGMLYEDSTGVSIYDITADKVILDGFVEGQTSEGTNAAENRVVRSKAILQKSHDLLQQGK